LANFSVRYDFLRLFGALACLFAGAVPAHGAELTLKPSITVSEEYNDNVFLTTRNVQEDFITRVSPGFTLDYNAPFWDWKVNAGVNYLHFLRNTEGDQFYPNVNVVNNTRLIDNFLYIDVSDSYTRVPLNIAYESLFTNQANQNFLTVSPYLKFHPLTRLELTAGYTYKNVQFDRMGTVDWQEHDLFFRAAHEITPRSNYFLNAVYAYTATSDNIHYSRLTPSVGIDYNYADGSHVSLEGGYSFLLLEGGATVASPYWNVGINYLFGSTIASLNADVTYNNDPTRNITERRGFTGGLTRQFSRGSIGASPYYYITKDYVTDSISQTSYGMSVTGTYKFTEMLEGHLILKGGKERGTSFATLSPGPFYVNGPPYYLATAETGLSYALNHDLNLFLTYINTTYLYEAGNSDNMLNNRVIVGITKTFQGLKF
jgi:hypothetical protein